MMCIDDDAVFVVLVLLETESSSVIVIENAGDFDIVQ